ncbi:IDEAL domain-containing protein [Heyndrickxia acidicola]|uniref:IDEAL domain-containing protein n=1 Tax=Heyndrickxia acidicola TaxID=209389 RepID=A0ABU6MI39_9BACI|nr:IDEAL domain-containing protein [Heyndrickxia acidicola]MED1204334.1 IDEAL domain-containing protein [Heyndrickxia acidicola]
MENNETLKLKIGDWVKGRSVEGELFQGYIEKLDFFQGHAKVKVTECDNKTTIGKSINVLDHWIKKIPAAKDKTLEQLLPLIDLALKTNDEEWFMELSNCYNTQLNQLDFNRTK